MKVKWWKLNDEREMLTDEWKGLTDEINLIDEIGKLTDE